MTLSKKTFVGDMFINMLATAIPVAVLNIIVYPLLVAHMITDDYGTLTTCVGLINLVNGIWGSSVSYTRLLDKSEGLIKRNYSILLSISTVLAIVMNILLLWMTGCIIANVNIVLVSICVGLIIFNNYMIVEYRLILSYKKILISNICSSIGYVVGFGIMVLTNYRRWEWVFIFGYGVAVIFNMCTTHIWKGKFEYDEHLHPLAVSTFILVITSSISGFSTYLDKLLIYPLLGATAMAYYQTASIIAKIIPMFAAAISNVLLSYLIKIKKISYKSFFAYNSILIAISVVGLVLCNIAVPEIIRFLYPSYYANCLDLIPFANIIAILQMFYSFVFPITLRYAARRKQYHIQLGRLIPYLILSLVLVKYRGLIGFCYATIISQVIQIIIVLCISLNAITGSDNDENC